jgi:hypothetical protein
MRWPREESNLRPQIRSSRQSQMGRDPPRPFGSSEQFRPRQRLFDLGLSRWVWWPHCGPMRGLRASSSATQGRSAESLVEKLCCYRRRGRVLFGAQTPSLHSSIFRISERPNSALAGGPSLAYASVRECRLSPCSRSSSRPVPARSEQCLLCRCRRVPGFRRRSGCRVATQATPRSGGDDIWETLGRQASGGECPPVLFYTGFADLLEVAKSSTRWGDQCKEANP